MSRVAPELAAEFPGLALRVRRIETAGRRTPEEVRERLRALGDRYTAARAVGLRLEAVPWAYRVFFRHVGLDPDERRTPAEAVALRRLREGGFRSEGLLADAMTIATAETGVALVAFDAAAVSGEPELRLSRAGERLEPGAAPLPPGRLVVADAARVLALLFVAVAADAEPRRERVVLCAVQVPGVPDASVEEALWTVAEIAGRR